MTASSRSCTLIPAHYLSEADVSGVVVLNTDNTALHTVSVKHAIKMLVREVAIVEEARDGHRIGPDPWP